MCTANDNNDNNDKINDINEIVIIDYTSKITERMNTNDPALCSANTSMTALLHPTPFGRPTKTKDLISAAENPAHHHHRSMITSTSTSTSTNLTAAVHYDNMTPMEVSFRNWHVPSTSTKNQDAAALSDLLGGSRVAYLQRLRQLY
jgi:hypothetical protein